MAARWQLTKFERRMVIGARRIRHSISELVNELNIPRSIVSRVCREFLILGITTHYGKRSGRPHDLNGRDRRRVWRIVCCNKQVTLRKMTAKMNVDRTWDMCVRTVLIKFGLNGLWQQKTDSSTITLCATSLAEPFLGSWAYRFDPRRLVNCILLGWITIPTTKSWR